MTDISFEEITYPSSNGTDTVHGYLFIPNHTKPRAIIQLSHGMCEHVERYDAWARRFAARGLVFCGNDHLGHGRTAKAANDLGFTAPRGGADLLVEDLYTMTVLMQKRFEGLPLILYGHSMGSFVARMYLTRYGEAPAGVLLSGTAGPHQPTGVGLALTRAIAGAKGYRHRSKLITSFAFGAYNKHFAGENDPNAWLTREREVRARYADDPLGCYVFTAAGYDTLFTLLSTVSRRDWAASVPKSLPIFLFSGEMDPIGNYGKGVREVARRLTKENCTVTLKLYRDARHELHNEKNRDEVFSDILDFIETHILFNTQE